MIEIVSIRHDWPEKSGFTILRPQGHKEYTFLHFLSPAEVMVKGVKYDVRPGGCIFYSPKQPQWYRSKCNLLHNWFHAKASIQPLLNELCIPVDEIFYPSDTRFISDIFYKAEIEFFSQEATKNIMIDALMMQFLCTLSRAINNPPVKKIHADNMDKMRFVRQKILSMPQKHFTVKQMASFVGLSPSRFHGIYKSVFGTSPIKDSIFARIEHSKNLLLSCDKPISQIAEMLGYTDQYHFIRQFKKETGFTPDKFRKK